MHAANRVPMEAAMNTHRAVHHQFQSIAAIIIPIKENKATIKLAIAKNMYKYIVCILSVVVPERGLEPLRS